MKKYISLLFFTATVYTSFAQTDSAQKELDSARKFLATTDVVYPYIDTPPAYPGGNTKWSEYIGQSKIMLTAIHKAKAAGIVQGKHTVVVKFAVTEDGVLNNITTTNKPVGYGLEEAAIKLVQGSGKWIPANIEGKITKAFLQLPVHFTIAQH